MTTNDAAGQSTKKKMCAKHREQYWKWRTTAGSLGREYDPYAGYVTPGESPTEVIRRKTKARGDFIKHQCRMITELCEQGRGCSEE